MVKDDVKAILIHTNGKVVIMADTNQNAAPQLSGTVLNFPEIVKRILSCLPAKVLCENVRYVSTFRYIIATNIYTDFIIQ